MKANVHNEMKAAGAYDGRYRPKVVQDKKKNASKKACRKGGFNESR